MKIFACLTLLISRFFSSDLTEQVRHIAIILKRLAKAKLKIKPMKCKFAQNTIKYLVTEQQGVKITSRDENKTCVASAQTKN